MNNIIKVNGYTINAATVGMLERFTDKGELTGKTLRTGVVIHFIGGGVKRITDPEAQEVEAAFMRYDGVQENELPY
jgi:hypothetical protein